jgi:ABC-2 type transport system permease protein
VTRIAAVAQREFLTVLRTPTTLALGGGFVALVVAIAYLGAPGAYLALVLDLLTPVEVLVPVLAFAFGYRALLGDRESGELETIRTYPVSAGRYVAGVFLGRAVALLAVLLVALAATGLLVPLTAGPGRSAVASHATVDSPALFLRYALVTAAFAVVALAVALLVSAAARSTRGGLALAAGSVLLVVVGLDSAALAALSGGLFGGDALAAVLAVSPASAYRALVFQTSLAPAGVAVPEGAAALVAAVGLAGWLVGALALAAALAWR